MSPLNPYESLPDRALLSALVGREQADRLLSRAKGSISLVLREASRPYDPRSQLPPSSLGAAVELVKRAYLEEATQRSLLTAPDLVREYLKLQLGHIGFEVFYCLMMDPRQHLIAAVEMFRGTLTQTAVYPREVVRLTLEHGAAAVILVHNHPSGHAEPSEADKVLTFRLKETLALIDVRVLDHIIVAGNATFSFAERGLI